MAKDQSLHGIIFAMLSSSDVVPYLVRVPFRMIKYFRKNAGGSYYPKASAKQAKAMMLAIMNAKNQDERKKHYKKLLRLADALLKQLPFALKRFEGFNEGGYFDRQLNELKNVAELLPLIISQTKRRVIKGETVASEEKVISIFEPHSDVIEGIISCLKRAFGLKRVTWRGVKGFASYVHSAVASYNLWVLARAIP